MTKPLNVENFISTEVPKTPNLRPSRATEVDVMIMKKVTMARIAKGWSQKELSNAMGISQQQLQKYEKGKNRIAASRLLHVSNLLKVEVGYFYQGMTSADKDFDRYISGGACKDLGLSSIGSAFMKIKNTHVQKSLDHLVKTIANDYKE